MTGADQGSSTHLWLQQSSPCMSVFVRTSVVPPFAGTTIARRGDGHAAECHDARRHDRAGLHRRDAPGGVLLRAADREPLADRRSVLDVAPPGTSPVARRTRYPAGGSPGGRPRADLIPEITSLDCNPRERTNCDSGEDESRATRVGRCGATWDRTAEPPRMDVLLIDKLGLVNLKPEQTVVRGSRSVLSSPGHNRRWAVESSLQTPEEPHVPGPSR
jgi:hypothetical protein